MPVRSIRGLAYRKLSGLPTEWSVGVRFAAHNGLKSDIAPCPFRARLGHQLSALIPKSKATPRRLRNFNLVLVTSPHAGYTSAERPVSIGIV
jgi:hypothetical protein